MAVCYQHEGQMLYAGSIETLMLSSTPARGCRHGSGFSQVRITLSGQSYATER